jgi:hypothetical protein
MMGALQFGSAHERALAKSSSDPDRMARSKDIGASLRVTAAPDPRAP